MASRREQARIASRVAPRLQAGEEVLGTAVVWAARVDGGGVLLAGRHRHHLALTDRRVLAFRRRDEEPSLDEATADLALERTGRAGWFSQLIVTTRDGRRLVLEFRLRDRATAGALAGTLGTTRAL
jgi:hypothetical protein